MSDASPDRIASNIVTDVGFLGAGVIFKSDNRLMELPLLLLSGQLLLLEWE